MCGGQTLGSHPRAHSLLPAQKSWWGDGTASQRSKATVPRPWDGTEGMKSQGPPFRDPLSWVQLSTQHGKRGDRIESGHTAFGLGCPCTSTAKIKEWDARLLVS